MNGVVSRDSPHSLNSSGQAPTVQIQDGGSTPLKAGWISPMKCAVLFGFTLLGFATSLVWIHDTAYDRACNVTNAKWTEDLKSQIESVRTEERALVKRELETRLMKADQNVFVANEEVRNLRVSVVKHQDELRSVRDELTNANANAEKLRENLRVTAIDRDNARDSEKGIAEKLKQTETDKNSISDELSQCKRKGSEQAAEIERLTSTSGADQITEKNTEISNLQQQLEKCKRLLSGALKIEGPVDFELADRMIKHADARKTWEQDSEARKLLAPLTAEGYAQPNEPNIIVRTFSSLGPVSLSKLAGLGALRDETAGLDLLIRFLQDKRNDRPRPWYGEVPNGKFEKATANQQRDIRKTQFYLRDLGEYLVEIGVLAE